jgi:hypothetical protein
MIANEKTRTSILYAVGKNLKITITPNRQKILTLEQSAMEQETIWRKCKHIAGIL